MTQDTSGYPPSGGSAVPSSDSPSTTQVARDEAAGVGRQAGQAGSQVAQSATAQAKEVTAEAKQQATNLAQQGLQQVRGQVQDTQLRAAVGVSGLADQLRGMATGQSQAPGYAQDLVNQAADRIEDVAGWLERSEPADLLEDLRTFARQRPGLFLLGSAVAGLTLGRLTRGVVASQSDSIDSPRSAGALESRHSADATFGSPALETPTVTGDYASTTSGFEGGGYGTTTGYATGAAGYDATSAGYGQQAGTYQSDPGYTQPVSGYGQHEASDYGQERTTWDEGTGAGYGSATPATEIDPITGEPRGTVEGYGTTGSAYPSSGQVRP